MTGKVSVLFIAVVFLLGTTAALSADFFSTPFTRHGVADPRISAYLPSFKKWRFPPRWGGWHFPCEHTRSCRSPERAETRSAEAQRPVVKEPIQLDPAIFNPSPKTPLTLVVEDGEIVDSYLGYEKRP